MALVISSLLATTAIGQDLPDESSLRQMLIDQLPPYWKLDTYKIIATTRAGDAVSPRALIRFEAEAAPSAPLFVLTAEEGPFAVVLPAAPDPTTEGAGRTLYGVSDLAYRAGEWAGGTLIENPVEGLGMPASFFDRPVVVLGSQEGEKALSLMRGRSVEAQLAQQESELAALREAHGTERATLQAVQDRAISLSKVEHEAAMAKKRREAEDALASIEESFSQKLAVLTEDSAPALEAAMQARALQLAEFEEETLRVLDVARAEADARLEELRADHARRRGSLIETQEAELAGLETRLSGRRAELEDRLAAAGEVLLLQDRLSSDLETIQSNLATLGRIEQEVVATRATTLEAVSGRWEGTASCGASQSAPSEAACPSTTNATSLAAGPFTCSCPPGPHAGQIWGTDMYTSNSATCLAAQHAGAIPAEASSPRRVTIIPEPGLQSYDGSSRNGVTSLAYGAWSASFRFETDELLQAATGGSDGLPQSVWSVSFTTDETFGTGKRGTFINIIHQDRSDNATSAATMTFTAPNVTGSPGVTLALDNGGPLAGSRILDLELAADGRLIGASRDGSCSSIELTRVGE